MEDRQENRMENNWKKKFAVIYAGQAFSLLGSAAVQFAVIWWLTVQTGSAITLTLATVVSFPISCSGLSRESGSIAITDAP